MVSLAYVQIVLNADLILIDTGTLNLLNVDHLWFRRESRAFFLSQFQFLLCLWVLLNVILSIWLVITVFRLLSVVLRLLLLRFIVLIIIVGVRPCRVSRFFLLLRLIYLPYRFSPLLRAR